MLFSVNKYDVTSRFSNNKLYMFGKVIEIDFELQQGGALIRITAV